MLLPLLFVMDLCLDVPQYTTVRNELTGSISALGGALELNDVNKCAPFEQ